MLTINWLYVKVGSVIVGAILLSRCESFYRWKFSRVSCMRRQWYITFSYVIHEKIRRRWIHKDNSRRKFVCVIHHFISHLLFEIFLHFFFSNCHLMGSYSLFASSIVCHSIAKVIIYQIIIILLYCFVLFLRCVIHILITCPKIYV